MAKAKIIARKTLPKCKILTDSKPENRHSLEFQQSAKSARKNMIQTDIQKIEIRTNRVGSLNQPGSLENDGWQLEQAVA
ncbi:MAG: hypothetical protein HKN23_17280 [Verrucomicrobiales bacterium]|nr:hypothetical protein [Verrucomicrobiales bacterium]